MPWVVLKPIMLPSCVQFAWTAVNEVASFVAASLTMITPCLITELPTFVISEFRSTEIFTPAGGPVCAPPCSFAQLARHPAQAATTEKLMSEIKLLRSIDNQLI